MCRRVVQIKYCLWNIGLVVFIRKFQLYLFFQLEANKYFLLKYEGDIHPLFNIPFISESIYCILKNNTYIFVIQYIFTAAGYCIGYCVCTYLCKPKHGVPWNQILWSYWIELQPWHQAILCEIWERLLDDGEILLNTGLIKLDDLLTILNSVKNDIQFSIELCDNKLNFLEILITAELALSRPA